MTCISSLFPVKDLWEKEKNMLRRLCPASCDSKWQITVKWSYLSLECWWRITTQILASQQCLQQCCNWFRNNTFSVSDVWGASCLMTLFLNPMATFVMTSSYVTDLAALRSCFNLYTCLTRAPIDNCLDRQEPYSSHQSGVIQWTYSPAFGECVFLFFLFFLWWFNLCNTKRFQGFFKLWCEALQRKNIRMWRKTVPDVHDDLLIHTLVPPLFHILNVFQCLQSY